MRILLLNQFFWPDSAPTSQFLTDVARELSARGHEVIAICGGGYYARDAAVPDEDRPCARICRAPAFPFGRGRSKRILSYASFFASAIWWGLAKSRPDLVLTLTTPPLLSLVGSLLKSRHGCPHWIWEMDVYPDIAVELGVIRRGGVVHKLSSRLADWTRRRADGVLVLGNCMKNRLLERGLEPHKLIVAGNWANGSKIRPGAFTERPILKILYSGNLGLAHDLDTLKRALLELNGTSIAHFVFAGGGGARSTLEQWAGDKQVQDISFRSYSTLEELSQSLADSDIGLVTQKKETLGMLVPSKIYGILASARPVLYIGPKQSTAHHIIETFGCGWQIDCGDSQRLVELLRTLHQNRSLIEETGQRARRAFLEQSDLKQGVARIADAVTSEIPVDCSPYLPVSSERYSI